jgi:hypothetical protein
MADKRIEIEVRTKGDTKGTDDVAKSLDKVAASAKKAGGDVQQNFFQRVFPTFSKVATGINQVRLSIGEMGKELGGMPGAILQGIANPWTAALGIITTAGAGIGKAIYDVNQRTKEFITWAGKGWKDLGLEIHKTGTATERARTAAKFYEDQLKSVTTAMDQELGALSRREAAIDKRLSDDERLAKSALDLAKARIDANAAEGQISEAEAATMKARLEQAAAESSYARAVEATNEVLAARREALQTLSTQVKEADKIAAAAKQDASLFAGQDIRSQADRVDPNLNRTVDLNRKEMAVSARESQDPGVLGRIGEVNDALSSMGALEKNPTIFGLIAQVKKVITTWTETTQRVEESQKLLEKARGAVDQAEQRRAQEVTAAQKAREAAASQAQANADAMRGKLNSAIDVSGEAYGQAQSMAPGGVDYQIEANRRATEQGTPAFDLVGLQQTDTLSRFAKAVIDGIEQREIAFLTELSAKLKFENKGGGVAQKLKQIEDQIADLRTKAN